MMRGEERNLKKKREMEEKHRMRGRETEERGAGKVHSIPG